MAISIPGSNTGNACTRPAIRNEQPNHESKRCDTNPLELFPDRLERMAVGATRMQHFNRPVRPDPAEKTEPPPKNLATQLIEGVQATVKRAVLATVGFCLGTFATIFGGEPESDLGTDGAHHNITSDNPVPANATKPDIIFVNGAGGNEQMALEVAQEFANTVGRDVELIHNATAVRQYPGQPLVQFAAFVADWHKDLEQMVNDFHDRGNNECVSSVCREILDRIGSGEEIQLVGFSQGNPTIARALRMAKEIRLKELTEAYGGNTRLAQQQLEREFARIEVVNLSGPAKYSDYPPEIPFENYMHAEMDRDPASTILGELADEYRDSEFDQRVQWASFDLALHAGEHDITKVLAKAEKELDALLNR